ncbi:hypothetical protein [uncultured Fibrobacter sp.]|uniref:hypothetical protein n=1 Tax=uncultured Fibrobacter sp. TaxID=261512 RepID=UPI002608A982|nr:hypothetical protein [uncultured Fibrobacter sp.]
MIDVQKYNRLKEINKKYGYGSWALWPPKDNSEEGDAKNKDVSFFDEREKSGELFNQLTDKVIMLALNPSGKNNGMKPRLWENFRGGRYDQRIFMLVKKFEKLKLEGCYITDLFKEKIGSSSKDAEEKIYKWKKEGILKEKVEPFINELNTIGLDSLDWIIVFGKGTTYRLLMNLVDDGFFSKEIEDKVKSVTHYSFRYMNDDKYLKCVEEQLKEQRVLV